MLMGIDYQYCIDCNECLYNECFVSCALCEETICKQFLLKDVYTDASKKTEFPVCDLCINWDGNKHLVVYYQEKKYYFCPYCISFEYQYDDGNSCSIVEYVNTIKQNT